MCRITVRCLGRWTKPAFRQEVERCLRVAEEGDVCESEVEVFHAYTRCVRRAFLCGNDTLTGKSFDHSKQWVQERLDR